MLRENPAVVAVVVVAVVAVAVAVAVVAVAVVAGHAAGKPLTGSLAT